jgi:hypothetical protein
MNRQARAHGVVLNASQRRTSASAVHTCARAVRAIPPPPACRVAALPRASTSARQMTRPLASSHAHESNRAARRRRAAQVPRRIGLPWSRVGGRARAVSAARTATRAQTRCVRGGAPRPHAGLRCLEAPTWARPRRCLRARRAQGAPQTLPPLRCAAGTASHAASAPQAVRQRRRLRCPAAPPRRRRRRRGVCHPAEAACGALAPRTQPRAASLPAMTEHASKQDACAPPAVATMRLRKRVNKRPRCTRKTGHAPHFTPGLTARGLEVTPVFKARTTELLEARLGPSPPLFRSAIDRRARRA